MNGRGTLGDVYAGAATLILGAVFAVSAFTKLISPSHAALSIERAVAGLGSGPSAPGSASPWRAIVLGVGVFEIILAGWLISGRRRTRASIATLAVLALFSVWLFIARDVIVIHGCGCGLAQDWFARRLNTDEFTVSMVRNGLLCAIATGVLALTPADPRGSTVSLKEGEAPWTERDLC